MGNDTLRQKSLEISLKDTQKSVVHEFAQERDIAVLIFLLFKERNVNYIFFRGNGHGTHSSWAKGEHLLNGSKRGSWWLRTR